LPAFDAANGIKIAYEVFGDGPPILLIHGFGSSGLVNWIETGWTETLAGAGYRAITIDNRGHGNSAKLYEPAAYHPMKMAEDSRALFDHLKIDRAAVFGYSMGARIAAFLALAHPDRVAPSVWGGMGMNLVTGLADSDEIIAALLAPRLADVKSRTGRQFRIFADRTGADKEALAACMVTSRTPMPEADVRRISGPVLVATGGDDVMAGPADALSSILPKGEAFTIPNRDHMRSTGDPNFKSAALDFLARNDYVARQP
jgi:pimeloyl-ACP methyl ester carboxylesterase